MYEVWTARLVAAIFPVPDVVGVAGAAGGLCSREPAHVRVAVLEGAAAWLG